MSPTVPGRPPGAFATRGPRATRIRYHRRCNTALTCAGPVRGASSRAFIGSREHLASLRFSTPASLSDDDESRRHAQDLGRRGGLATNFKTRSAKAAAASSARRVSGGQPQPAAPPDVVIQLEQSFASRGPLYDDVTPAPHADDESGGLERADVIRRGARDRAQRLRETADAGGASGRAENLRSRDSEQRLERRHGRGVLKPLTVTGCGVAGRAIVVGVQSTSRPRGPETSGTRTSPSSGSSFLPVAKPHSIHQRSSMTPATGDSVSSNSSCASVALARPIRSTSRSRLDRPWCQIGPNPLHARSRLAT